MVDSDYISTPNPIMVALPILINSEQLKEHNQPCNFKHFETIGKTQVDNALSGYNNSIFAYGQTGTGKTYTMLGPNGGHGDLNDTKASQSLGLIPRILHYLFESINKAQEAREESNTNVNTVNKVTISYMEIYQENVRDLLDPNVDHPTNLVVKEHK